jgi:nucleoside-diphosphate-sugar epimerase
MAHFTIMGASGFIGSALVRHLKARGHQVTLLNRDADLPPDPGHVIYAIGLTADFRHRPFATSRAHVCRLTDVLEKGRGESFLYLSSTRVYEGATSTNETSTLKVDPLNPNHLYNLTKLAGEALVLQCGQPAARVVRLSNIVGPLEATRETFLAAILKDAALGQIRLLSNPASAKDYVWLEDALPLLEMIALSARSRIYNLASGRQISHAEWLAAIAAMTGATVETDYNAADGGFPPIDTSRIFTEFEAVLSDPRDHLLAILGREATHKY